MVRKQVILENLNCANCASKIEDEVNQIDGLNASMNFISKILTLEAEPEYDFSNAMNQVQTIARKHEPDVVVAEKLDPPSAWENATNTGSFPYENTMLLGEHRDDTTIPEIRSGSDPFETTHAVNQDAGKAAANTKKKIGEILFENTLRKQIIKLIIGSVLFTAGMILQLGDWQELILFLISYLIAGGTVILKAIKGILRGQAFNENFLMSVATIGAFLIGEYPEGVAVMLFYLIGEIFENQAIGQSR